jgi:hypothetical protein
MVSAAITVTRSGPSRTLLSTLTSLSSSRPVRTFRTGSSRLFLPLPPPTLTVSRGTTTNLRPLAAAPRIFLR